MAADGTSTPGAAFLAALSSAVREPLRSLTHWLALLADAPDPDTIASVIEGLEATRRQQAELADHLLEAATLADGQPLRRTTFDVVVPLRASVDRHRGSGRRQDVEVSIEAPSHPVLVSGDEPRLEKVLDRLLDNALAAAVAGTAVRARIRTVDGHCEIEIAEDAAHDGTVRHGGGGLPEVRRDTLGVMLARHVIEAHGGSMETVGRGATLHLPRDGAPAPPTELPLLGDVRILVVDDDQTSREALADALSILGARVTVAPSVAAALARWRAERFDVVCSDIEMPGESGVELAHAVRASEPGGARQPLVAISGLIGDDHGDAARAAGFDACWPKPIDVPQLARGLRALVDAARRAQLERNSPAVANEGT